MSLYFTKQPLTIALSTLGIYELSGFMQAFKVFKWRRAMDEKFTTLYKQGPEHWLLSRLT